MSKCAILTGASQGIGVAIALKLLELEYHVWGISRHAPSFTHPHFHFVSCDLSQPSHVIQTCHHLTQTLPSVDVLINNAGVGYFAPHEEISDQQLIDMAHINFLAPLLITKHTIRPLKKSQGWIISISSHSSKVPSRLGCAYASTKAALSHFQDSLFEEVRKSGIKVGTLIPDITNTPFFDTLSFAPSENPLSYLTPECVANGVAFMLSQRQGSVITEMVLRPEILQLDKKGKKKNS